MSQTNHDYLVFALPFFLALVSILINGCVLHSVQRHKSQLEYHHSTQTSKLHLVDLIRTLTIVSILCSLFLVFDFLPSTLHTFDKHLLFHYSQTLKVLVGILLQFCTLLHLTWIVCMASHVCYLFIGIINNPHQCRYYLLFAVCVSLLATVSPLFFNYDAGDIVRYRFVFDFFHSEGTIKAQAKHVVLILVLFRWVSFLCSIFALFACGIGCVRHRCMRATAMNQRLVSRMQLLVWIAFNALFQFFPVLYETQLVSQALHWNLMSNSQPAAWLYILHHCCIACNGICNLAAWFGTGRIGYKTVKSDLLLPAQYPAAARATSHPSYANLVHPDASQTPDINKNNKNDFVRVRSIKSQHSQQSQQSDFSVAPLPIGYDTDNTLAQQSQLSQQSQQQQSVSLYGDETSKHYYSSRGTGVDPNHSQSTLNAANVVDTRVHAIVASSQADPSSSGANSNAFVANAVDISLVDHDRDAYIDKDDNHNDSMLADSINHDDTAAAHAGPPEQAQMPKTALEADVEVNIKQTRATGADASETLEISIGATGTAVLAAQAEVAVNEMKQDVTVGQVEIEIKDDAADARAAMDAIDEKADIADAADAADPTDGIDELLVRRLDTLKYLEAMGNKSTFSDVSDPTQLLRSKQNTVDSGGSDNSLKQTDTVRDRREYFEEIVAQQDAGSIFAIADYANESNKWINWFEMKSDRFDFVRQCWFDPVVHDSLADNAIFHGETRMKTKMSQESYSAFKLAKAEFDRVQALHLGLKKPEPSDAINIFSKFECILWKQGYSHANWQKRKIVLNLSSGPSKGWFLQYLKQSSSRSESWSFRNKVDLSKVYFISTQFRQIDVEANKSVLIKGVPNVASALKPQRKVAMTEVILHEPGRKWILASESYKDVGTLVGLLDSVLNLISRDRIASLPTQMTQDTNNIAKIANNMNSNRNASNLRMHGWMIKTDPNGKYPKQRWFCLDSSDGSLRYYASDAILAHLVEGKRGKIVKMTKKHLKGEINVKTDVLHVGPNLEREFYETNPFCFDIVCNHIQEYRIYRLTPQTMEEMYLWIKHLRDMIVAPASKKSDETAFGNALLVGDRVFKRLDKSPHPGTLVANAGKEKNVWREMFVVLTNRAVYYFNTRESYHLYRRRCNCNTVDSKLFKKLLKKMKKDAVPRLEAKDVRKMNEFEDPEHEGVWRLHDEQCASSKSCTVFYELVGKLEENRENCLALGRSKKEMDEMTDRMRSDTELKLKVKLRDIEEKEEETVHTHEKRIVVFEVESGSDLREWVRCMNLVNVPVEALPASNSVVF